MYIRSSTPSQIYKESRRYFGSDLVLQKIQSHLYHSNILRHYCGILHLGLVLPILGFNRGIPPGRLAGMKNKRVHQKWYLSPACEWSLNFHCGRLPSLFTMIIVMSLFSTIINVCQPELITHVRAHHLIVDILEPSLLRAHCPITHL